MANAPKTKLVKTVKTDGECIRCYRNAAQNDFAEIAG